MPLYEYQCDACGNRFEVIQKFSDPPLDACRACGGQVRKLLSSPAIQFKGSGWYITDYARQGGQNGSGATSSSSAEPAKTSSESSTTSTSTSTTASGTGGSGSSSSS